MRRVWRELRGAVSAMVLLGLVARLLMPLGAMAATQQAAFDIALRGQICLGSGLPAPDDTTDGPQPARGDHCALCRLPDPTGFAPPLLVLLPAPRLATAPVVVSRREESAWSPPTRGPPPARAPPFPPMLA